MDTTRPAALPNTAADPVVDAYKRDVDRTLLRENLKLTPDERLQKLSAFVRFLDEVRRSRPLNR